MVIPMGAMGPQLRGPVPAECATLVRRVKLSVFAMIACAIGRLVTAMFLRHLSFSQELMQALSPVLVIIMATFILQEDEHFKAAYNFLATSICQQCHEQGMGGLACLMPFAVCCGLNTVLDILFKLGTSLDPDLMPYGILVGGSIVAEGAAAYFGWKTYTMVRDAGLGSSPDVEMGNGGLGAMAGGFLGGGARQPGYQQPADQSDSAQPQAQAPAPSGFQPFAGSGQRLGS